MTLQRAKQRAALFLASDEARFITGTEIVVDGGMTVRCGATSTLFAATAAQELSRRGRSAQRFITGSDFLMDGGVTAAYWYGELAPK